MQNHKRAENLQILVATSELKHCTSYKGSSDYSIYIFNTLEVIIVFTPLRKNFN